MSDIVWNILDFYEGTGPYTYKELLKRKKLDDVLVSMAYPAPDVIDESDRQPLMANINHVAETMLHVLKLMGIEYGDRFEVIQEWSNPNIRLYSAIMLAMCYFFYTIGAYDLDEIMFYTIDSLQKRIKFSQSFQRSINNLKNEFLTNQVPLSIILMETLNIEAEERILDMEGIDTGFLAARAAREKMALSEEPSSSVQPKPKSKQRKIDIIDDDGQVIDIVTEKQWTCPICTHENSLEQRSCIACASPRPRDAISSSLLRSATTRQESVQRKRPASDRSSSGLKDPFDDDDDSAVRSFTGTERVITDRGKLISSPFARSIDKTINKTIDKTINKTINPSKPGHIFEEMCPGLDGLNYNDNSCYQDTTLLCLIGLQNPIQHSLLTPTFELSREALAVQRELIFLSRVMKKETEERKTCGMLRQLIARTNTDRDRFSGTEEQDAGEFVMYLFDLIKVPQISFVMETIYSNKDGFESNRTVQNVQGDPIMKVHSSSLQEGVSIQDVVLNTVERSELDPPFRGFNVKEDVTGVDNANFLIVYIDRLVHDEYGREQRSKLSVAINPEIRLMNPGASRLELYAIIVHRSHHYVAFFKCADVWWLYNDISRDHFEHVGTLNNVIDHEENPSKMGTLFFYRAE